MVKHLRNKIDENNGKWFFIVLLNLITTRIASTPLPELSPAILNFTTPKENPSVLGRNESFSCTTRYLSTENYTVFWKKSVSEDDELKTLTNLSRVVIKNDKKTESTFTSTLGIYNLSTDDLGFYSCEICLIPKNDGDNCTRYISQQVLLDVQVPLKFDNNPDNLTIRENGKINLTCTAIGKPLPQIIWAREGNKLLSINNNTTYVNKILYFKKVNRRDDGIYRCVAKNDVGNDKIKKYQLTVQYKPEIRVNQSKVLQPKNCSSCDAFLNITVEAKPKPIISCKKDGEELLNETRFNVFIDSNEGETHYTLKINNASYIDDGNYTFKASNELGDTFTTIEFIATVQYKPEIQVNHSRVLQPKNCSRCDAFLNFTVDAKSKPIITYKRNGEGLLNATRFKTLIDSNDGKIFYTLKIINASYIDDGNYIFKASNELGDTFTIIEFIATVQNKPEIQVNHSRVLQPKNCSRCDAFLNFTVDAKSKPIITYKRNGEELLNATRFKTLIDSNDGKIFYTLKIINASYIDDGNYTFKASNELGDTFTIIEFIANRDNDRPMPKKPCDIICTKLVMYYYFRHVYFFAIFSVINVVIFIAILRLISRH